MGESEKDAEEELTGQELVQAAIWVAIEAIDTPDGPDDLDLLGGVVLAATSVVGAASVDLDGFEEDMKARSSTDPIAGPFYDAVAALLVLSQAIQKRDAEDE